MRPLAAGRHTMSRSRVYTDRQAAERLAAELPRWTVETGRLYRRYASDGWRASMLIANGIAHLAEVAWHHPDLHIGWGGVTVRLRTHVPDAITDKDFELAGMIEHWVCWRPQQGAALEGAPRDGQWRYLAED